MPPAALAAPAINTSKVGRRTVSITTPDDLRAEIERIVTADRAGQLTVLGNWSTGQALRHLAAWINYAFDGFPRTPPWFVKIILRLLKSRFFEAKGLSAGVRIPGATQGTWGVGPLTVDEREQRVLAAWARLRAGPPSAPHPVFGLLSSDEWWAMHLARARLHLSFLVPNAPK